MAKDLADTLEYSRTSDALEHCKNSNNVAIKQNQQVTTRAKNEVANQKMDNKEKQKTMIVLSSLVAVFYFEMEQKWSIFSIGTKKGFDFARKPLIYLVAMGGVEPPTLGL